MIKSVDNVQTESLKLGYDYKLDNKKYLDTKKFLGFGSFTKDNLFSSFFHKFFQKRIYGKEIFTTEEYHKYRNFFHIQSDFVKCIFHQ